MRKRTFETIAAELEKRLQQNPDCRLPTIRELSLTWNVAYQTMWKALHVLAEKGLIAVAQGRRMIAGTGTQPAFSSNTTDRLIGVIRNRIEQGIYKVKKPLPKMRYFVLSEHVSYATVTQAYFRLAQQNRIHRIGRQWIAGPEQPHGPSSSKADAQPVIMAVMSAYTDWSSMFQNPFLGQLMVPFSNELVSHSIRVSPGLLSQQHGGISAIPSTMDSVESAIKKLAGRYGGTVIHTTFPDEIGLKSWISMLAGFKKPVVFLDSVDKGEYFTRKNLSTGPGFFRLYFDERAAITFALTQLANAGHSMIGIHGYDLYDWSERRALRIKESAARFNPAIEIIESTPAEPVWSKSGASGSGRFISRLERQAGLVLTDEKTRENARQQFKRLLRKDASSFTSLLADGRPTAILCMNDHLARQYYLILQLLGVKIPDDISILSFDNIAESIYVPVSTIDFGFERLGYLAAHIFIGDIPVKSDVNGGIPGACMLVDRGSIAAPGDPRRLQRLMGG
jgi:DNA-binding LacI/PurR family transcriptional regulator/DNA-binding transcriptional regulator YhcF (GntR family)